ncbi:MAG: beta-eliminating lyase-related protein [Flavobacteriaceae bacterium]|nr:beta-eliminating lyase-related protein [Flavobacteriaceae bacterium]
MEINLISDTITRPTPQMLEAMMAAKVGDDVFNADPTVIQLQEKMAELFGMEAALYFPSGTMANQTAIKIHTQPAEQMICDKWAHVFNFEGGGAAFNSGISCSLLDGSRGMFTAEQVEKAINDPENYHTPITSLVAVENTTNKGGGACWDYTELQKIRKVCDAHHLAYHLDGARLFNALVAKNESPKQYGELLDTISVCLSKGLGAPVGSVLLGSEAQIKKAVRIRKLYGGAMRQVGYLAAAGIYALDHHVERLADDHARAKQIGEVLKNSQYIEKVEPIETNIVIFYVKEGVSETAFVDALKAKNILFISMGDGKLRMVTHLDFTQEMLEVVKKEIKHLKL